MKNNINTIRDFIRINEHIRVPEVRLIGSEGEALGVFSTQEALALAKKQSLDLIEISPKAKPPVAKIMDYGKFQYERKKKEKAAKARSRSTETKSLQVKIGTGDHDLALKAKRASEWLKEGHRIKLDLYLRGRAKYMEQNFLKERLNRLLNLITEDYKLADEPKKSPKGLTVVVEKAKTK